MAPKRAAGVAKQHLNVLVPLTEKQETCALYFGWKQSRIWRSHLSQPHPGPT
jgi:hypothetical protein